MNLILLAGVWALAFGHIELGSTRMKGREARMFGVLAILAASYAFPHIAGYFNAIAPKFITGNETFNSAYGLGIGAVTLYATAWVTTEVLPKLRIPMLKISTRRARA